MRLAISLIALAGLVACASPPDAERSLANACNGYVNPPAGTKAWAPHPLTSGYEDAQMLYEINSKNQLKSDVQRMERTVAAYERCLENPTSVANGRS